MRAPSAALPRVSLADETWRVLLLAPLLLATALAGGLIAGQVASGHQAGVVALPLVTVVPIWFWRRPSAAPLVLLSGATVVEQWTYTIGTKSGPFTDRIPLFRTFTHGMTILPIEALLALAFLVWLMKSVLDHSFRLPRSRLSRALLVFWVPLVVALGVGLSHGGQFNFALWELRPWLLLSVAYLITWGLLRTRASLESVLWVFVLGSGFKALQGDYIFFSYTRNLRPRPESILGHEEALFFSLFIILTAALWFYGQQGRLRTVATALLPVVLVADLANARRTAWANLFAGLAVLLVAAWAGLPEKRRLVAVLTVAVGLASVIYFPVYWNHDGTLAQPARAVKSGVAPDPRDQASNLYRTQEDANLRLNIQQSGILGKGFGVPINYALPIVDISSSDPMIKYIPHNGLLWIWMRLGLQGEILFWVLVGTGVLGAGRLARSEDRQLALLGGFIACALVAYVIQGYDDVGFASLRIAVAIGCLLGCLEAASHLDRRPPGSDESKAVPSLAEVQPNRVAS